MLFGKNKAKEGSEKCSNVPRNIVDELDSIDDKYMKAFSIRSTRALQEHLTRDCLVKVNQSVFSIGTRYFGAAKFRNTDWSTVETDGTTMKVLKDVSFDKVKVAGSMYIDVADSYKEIWTIIVNAGNKLMISDIQKV